MFVNNQFDSFQSSQNLTIFQSCLPLNHTDNLIHACNGPNCVICGFDNGMIHIFDHNDLKVPVFWFQSQFLKIKSLFFSKNLDSIITLEIDKNGDYHLIAYYDWRIKFSNDDSDVINDFQIYSDDEDYYIKGDEEDIEVKTSVFEIRDKSIVSPKFVLLKLFPYVIKSCFCEFSQELLVVSEDTFSLYEFGNDFGSAFKLITKFSLFGMPIEDLIEVKYMNRFIALSFTHCLMAFQLHQTIITNVESSLFDKIEIENQNSFAIDLNLVSLFYPEVTEKYYAHPCNSVLFEEEIDKSVKYELYLVFKHVCSGKDHFFDITIDTPPKNVVVTLVEPPNISVDVKKARCLIIIAFDRQQESYFIKMKNKPQLLQRKVTSFPIVEMKCSSTLCVLAFEQFIEVYFIFSSFVNDLLKPEELQTIEKSFFNDNKSVLSHYLLSRYFIMSVKEIVFLEGLCLLFSCVEGHKDVHLGLLYEDLVLADEWLESLQPSFAFEKTSKNKNRRERVSTRDVINNGHNATDSSVALFEMFSNPAHLFRLIELVHFLIKSLGRIDNVNEDGSLYYPKPVAGKPRFSGQQLKKEADLLCSSNTKNSHIHTHTIKLYQVSQQICITALERLIKFVFGLLGVILLKKLSDFMTNTGHLTPSNLNQERELYLTEITANCLALSDLTAEEVFEYTNNPIFQNVRLRYYYSASFNPSTIDSIYFELQSTSNAIITLLKSKYLFLLGKFILYSQFQQYKPSEMILWLKQSIKQRIIYNNKDGFHFSLMSINNTNKNEQCFGEIVELEQVDRLAGLLLSIETNSSLKTTMYFFEQLDKAFLLEYILENHVNLLQMDLACVNTNMNHMNDEVDSEKTPITLLTFLRNESPSLVVNIVDRLLNEKIITIKQGLHLLGWKIPLTHLTISDRICIEKFLMTNRHFFVVNLIHLYLSCLAYPIETKDKHRLLANDENEFDFFKDEKKSFFVDDIIDRILKKMFLVTLHYFTGLNIDKMKLNKIIEIFGLFFSKKTLDTILNVNQGLAYSLLDDENVDILRKKHLFCFIALIGLKHESYFESTINWLKDQILNPHLLDFTLKDLYFFIDNAPLELDVATFLTKTFFENTDILSHILTYYARKMSVEDFILFIPKNTPLHLCCDSLKINSEKRIKEKLKFDRNFIDQIINPSATSAITSNNK
eukprot:TRINITY_DN1407_c0_g1_i1.p1 TRINITY_DN1407_c0_g1~~TRINITY_DN1407_c0_g1_i1.p1  ORF type:complete len:1173 (-),score=262.04 TRINITY_DN1407_c0_g1_i1:1643-5161(-)